MNINDKNKSKDFEFLFNAVLKLETVEECYSFFEDLCTIQELISIAQRLRVAKLLTEKKIYNDIVKETGASTATISRVNRTLNYGNGGYTLAFDRMDDESGTQVNTDGNAETGANGSADSPAAEEKSE